MVRKKNCLFCGVLIKNIPKKEVEKFRTDNSSVVPSYRSIGSFQKQKFCSSKCSKKGGDFARGERNPNWNGGKSPLRKLVSALQKYKKWRLQVFGRDNYTCQGCMKRGGYLEADHIKPFVLIIRENNITTIKEVKQCDEIWDINNGRTLCRKCHIKTFIFLGNQHTA